MNAKEKQIAKDKVKSEWKRADYKILEKQKNDVSYSKREKYYKAKDVAYKKYREDIAEIEALP